MRLILLGAPGAGKGTQASNITQHFKIPQISTGDMLRAMARSGTDFGNQLKTIMDSGALVSDDIIIKTVQQRLEAPDCSNGYLFDGFPRTIPQAEALKTNQVKLDYVVEFDVPEEEIILRVTGRWVHQESGRIYHTVFNPPKVAGKDDLTGDTLIQRPDDTEATVRKRLEVYRAETFPLIEYYRKWEATKDPAAPRFVKISGVGSVDDIKNRILNALK